MHSGIYQIRCLINNKIYIGSSKEIEKRWEKHKRELSLNRHHNIILQRSYNKHGIDNFSFEILEETKTWLLEREQYFIESLDTKNRSIGYNIMDANGGDMLTYHPNKVEIIAKISSTVNKNIAKLTDQERKDKYGRKGYANGMYGKTHTKEVKEKLSKIHIGNSYSAGRIMSNGQKEQLSVLASKRIGDKNPFYGRTHSDETKKKISEARKGKKPSNIRKVIIDEIVYDSCSEAARRLYCCTATILHRIKSTNKKFDGYNYAN